MANPALRSAFTSAVEKTPAGYPAHPGYQPQGGQTYGQGAEYGAQATDWQSQQTWQGQNQPTWQPTPATELEHMYNQPSAMAVDRGQMTIDDVVVKTSVTLGTVVVTAAIAWMIGAANLSLAYGLMIVGLIGGLVFGIWNALRKEPSPGLILTYAVFEGVLVGSFSMFMNTLVPGAVAQAVFATILTFVVCLILFKTGVIRVNQKFRSIVKIALWSYLAFALINLLFMLIVPNTGLFGIRSMQFGGITVGLVIGLIAVIIAAAMLMIDFQDIVDGLQAGVPAKYAWSAAFGLTVTLIWMYLEILRIIAIIASER